MYTLFTYRNRIRNGSEKGFGVLKSQFAVGQSAALFAAVIPHQLLNGQFSWWGHHQRVDNFLHQAQLPSIIHAELMFVILQIYVPLFTIVH